MTHQIDAYGYAGVVFLMFLENLVPPIPSEAIMPLAGFAARAGRMTLWGVILAGTLGSVLGNLPLYALARWVGPEGLKRWAERHGKWIRVGRRDVERAEKWFERWGWWAVLLCRVVPGVRTLISAPAGFARMPLHSFLIVSTLGTACWSAGLALIGWQLGALHNDLPIVSWISIAVIGSLLVTYIVWAARKRDAS